MHKINEWDPVFPKKTSPPNPLNGVYGAQAISVPISAGAIQDGLMSMKPQPIAVHLYRGEGLRWIRVGFDGVKPIKPELVGAVGRVIASCVANSGPLFFHALRPHDMLFFLPGGDADSIGMPAESYGTPLDEVLHVWGLKTKPARRASR